MIDLIYIWYAHINVVEFVFLPMILILFLNCYQECYKLPTYHYAN